MWSIQVMWSIYIPIFIGACGVVGKWAIVCLATSRPNFVRNCYLLSVEDKKA